MTDILGGAKELLAAGLPHSAFALLSSVRTSNFNYNKYRQIAVSRAHHSQMPTGIYALVAAENEAGLVIQIECSLGDPDKKDDKFGSLQDWASNSKLAFQLAYQWCEKRLGLATGQLPGLVPTTPDLIYIEGDSIGLASALSLLVKATGFTLDRPVLATGAVDKHGKVLPVGHLQQKLAAANLEMNSSNGVVLAPPGAATAAPGGMRLREVGTIDEAIEVTWGGSKLELDSGLVDFNALLEKVHQVGDHREAAQQLRGIREENLPPVDQAILYFELGKRLRHTGDIDGAREAHGRIDSILTPVLQGCLPESVTAETIEIETLRSEMAGNTTVQMMNEIEQRLEAGVNSAHNGVRLRGMLAELRSTLGLHEGVLELRKQNLEIQPNSTSMKKEIPRTLCQIVWEAARARDESAFERYLEELLNTTPATDQKQRLFNDAAIVKGMVALGRYEELMGWLSGKPSSIPEPAGVQLQQLVGGTTSISKHPQVSTARALVRAYRKMGQVDKAIELADRIDIDAPEHMMRWLCLAASIEKAMALVQKGRNDDAAALLQNVISAYLDELMDITRNIPSFSDVTIEDADNIDARFWEPMLNGIYH